MTDQEEQSLKEAKRKEKRATEEIEQLAIRQSARDQVRRKDTLTREQAIVEDQEARKLKSKKQTLE